MMVRAAIVLLLLALLLPSAARAEARIALVITNQAYTQSGARLTNTHRDGDVVKAEAWFQRKRRSSQSPGSTRQPSTLGFTGSRPTRRAVGTPQDGNVG